MNTVVLSPADLAISASLVAFDAALSVGMRLGVHRQVLWAGLRMVVQLIAVGYLLHYVFALKDPAVTVGLIVVMAAIAAREIVARPERGFAGATGYVIAGSGVAIATVVTVGLALATAIRPQPWFDPRYAIPLAGIVLGSVLNAGSLTLDTFLSEVRNRRAAIETQLALGCSYRVAIAPMMRNAIRRGLLPIVNQMSAAGVITLPGIMTGQILAGADPIDAVKYQILLLFLLAGASGLTGVSIAFLTARRLTDARQRLRLDRLR